nr:hypothetical protein [Candidatus Sigynarchaeota archaeon]
MAGDDRLHPGRATAAAFQDETALLLGRYHNITILRQVFHGNYKVASLNEKFPDDVFGKHWFRKDSIVSAIIFSVAFFLVIFDGTVRSWLDTQPVAVRLVVLPSTGAVFIVMQLMHQQIKKRISNPGGNEKLALLGRRECRNEFTSIFLWPVALSPILLAGVVVDLVIEGHASLPVIFAFILYVVLTIVSFVRSVRVFRNILHISG